MNKINYISEEEFLDSEVLESWILSYAKQIGIEIIFDSNPELIAAIDPSDLKHPKIYLNINNILEKYSFTKEEFYFVLFHELEHLKEDIELRATRTGEEIYEKRNEKLEERGNFKMIFHELENYFRDVFVNNQVIHPMNAPSLKNTRYNLYKDKFFKQVDYTKFEFEDENGNKIVEALPKHKQFIFSVLREEMIPDEQCIVLPEIRNILKRLRRNGILGKSISGKFEDRLNNLWDYVEPIYEKLLEEDLKEQQEQKNQENDDENNESNNEGNKDNENGNGSGNGEEQKDNEQGDGEKENNESGEGEGEEQGNNENGDGEGDGEEQEENENRDGEEENNESGEGEGEEQGNNENGDGEGDGEEQEENENRDGEEENNESGKGEGEEEDNENGEGEGEGNGNGEEKDDNGENNEKGKKSDPFGKFSDLVGNVPHIIEDNISEDEKNAFKKSIKEIIEGKKQSNKPKTKEELELIKRIKELLGEDVDDEEFETIKDKLEEYDEYVNELEKIEDSETHNYIIEEISELLKKIKSRREKPRYQYKGPVDQEIGVGLDTASIAQGIGEILSGNTNPEMFEREIIIEKHKDFVGKFDLTLIADGSFSMSQNFKYVEQKKAFLIIFEALKRLNDKLFLEKSSLLKSIDFFTRGLMFDGTGVIELKERSNDFTDKDRLAAFKNLDYCNGNRTNDYHGLEKVIEEFDNLSYSEQQEIFKGNIKKIVIVLSDGGSSHSDLMKKKIKYLREKGVLVYGIGITNSGKPVLDLYKGENQKYGFGQVCEDSSDLAKVLKDLLKEHLEKI